VSTPSLRSVGHSPHVHGTQAQIYLATSPYLYVVRNILAQDQIQSKKKPAVDSTTLIRKIQYDPQK